MDFVGIYFAAYSKKEKKRDDIGSGFMCGSPFVQWNLKEFVLQDTPF